MYGDLEFFLNDLTSEVALADELELEELESNVLLKGRMYGQKSPAEPIVIHVIVDAEVFGQIDEI